MIQQRIGDLLEIEQGGMYFYVVVLSKVVMFGGNILFAFHNDGQKQEISSLTSDCSGFNICADLLLPKREDRVTRLHRWEDVAPFWRSNYAKATHEYRLGVKAKEYIGRRWIAAATASTLLQGRCWRGTRRIRMNIYERYAASFPITYAQNVKAPVLIIQGRNDTRTPARSVEKYEETMKALGKVVGGAS